MKLKKWAIMALSIVTAVSLAACSSDKGASTDAKGVGFKEKIEKRGKFIAGVKFDSNLFGFKDPADQTVKGFEVDLMKEFTKRTFGDVNMLELKEVTSKTREKMLTSGEIDVIAATMTITPKRKETADFSRVYFLAGQALLVKKGSPIKDVKDLNGKQVGTAKGAVSGKNLKAINKDAVVKEYSNYAEAFQALRGGIIDAVTTDDGILAGMAKQDPNYEVVGNRFSKEPYGVAVDKKNKDLLEAMNKFLDDTIKDGTYNQLYKKWFGQDAPKDLPRDAVLELQPGVDG
ncbi:putative glutamine transport system substrate-binding protein [Croceifilum oryzae]|uniref:Glutamine transport system substrate-binding protein n=1 Tax=Croceifilum oryzae TaxID=1553429 RepID=A0AAJ1WR95_9BACL|nr:transporter substrate-binding domain-containing protein [Croceifilum oryzae]MDQ0416078.1 putative glutamine transport system substrate-binding protein [Croceifilum oryzae]